MKSMTIPWWVKFRMVFLQLLFLSSLLQAQETLEFEKIGAIPIQSKLVSVSPLGKILVVSSDNTLIQYDSKGMELNRYSNRQKGNISSLHCTNPFSIIIDYSDYRVTQVLDKTLSFNEEFSLDDFFSSQTRIFTLSRDNHLWIYDESNASLKKITFKGEILYQSNALNLLFQTELQPNSLVEYENQLYLNEPDTGILVFDNFGQFEKTIDLKGLERFTLLNKYIIFKENGVYKRFHLDNLLTSQINFPEALHQKEIHFANDFLLVREKQNLDILIQKK